ncbi:MAG: class I SAM-dependent methyltransferase [Candidatus Omnitrophica bacterium]|nr:class I SAM-dependent methyltransferase [Candidatus Omnitrophota bacterium]
MAELRKIIVSPDLYTKEYYLSDCEGHREYFSGLDNATHPLYKMALEIADIKHSESVLDIGCGRGELVFYSVMKGAKAIGLDYSKDAIEIAKETIKKLPVDLQDKAEAYCADATDYVFNRKLDVVFMLEVAEHMHDWQLEKLLSCLGGLLSDKGRIIIITPNYYYEKYLQPLKRFLDIPFQMIKWPLRIFRGKYKYSGFGDIMHKIFGRIIINRGETHKKRHCNITTPARLKRLLKDFDASVYCHDPSVAPISLLLKHWWGLHVIAIARKKQC